jgi:uncharacterized protein YndB with AHSA1/START domain
VPVHRLAYSFGWDGSEEVPPGSSLVEIDLMEQPPSADRDLAVENPDAGNGIFGCRDARLKSG